MKSKITTFFISLTALLLSMVSLVSAQSEQDAYRVETFQTSSSPNVEINTSGGYVHVFGHDSDEVKVIMIAKRGRRFLSPSDTDLSDFEIEIEKSGDSIIASAKRENTGISRWFSGNNNISISFEVYMPSGANVKGRTSGGSVKAENLTNSVELRTSGGSVTANHVHGTAVLRTSGGSITLNDLNGTISARTSGGSIRAEQLLGEAELRTSGGSIRIEDSDAKLTARTSGGSIRAYFTDFRDDIDLRTSGGSIRIEIPPKDHFNIDLTGNRVVTELRNFTGSSERNKITGRIGNGGPLLSARTSGGSVSLDYN